MRHPRRGFGTVIAIKRDENGDMRAHVEFSEKGDVHRYLRDSWEKMMVTGVAVFRSDKRVRLPRIFDSRFGFFHNISTKLIRIRVEPTIDSDLLAKLAIERDAVVRAEETSGEFIRLAGKWGTGWIPKWILVGDENCLVLRPIAAGQVVMTEDFYWSSLQPMDVTREVLPPPEDGSDEVLHRFEALAALNPSCGITWDVVQHALPAHVSEIEIDIFMQTFDKDNDGHLNLEEYREADADMVKRWRYASIWAHFALADDDRDGVLNLAEISPVLPISVGVDAAQKWMARFDKTGQHGVITLGDFTALERAVRKDDRVTVIGAAVTMSIFIAYIRTAKAVMAMFSVETIEGISYLKPELGTPAFTYTHDCLMAIAAIYAFFFVIGIPVAALYVIFLNRHRLEHRRIRSTFGFLFEGYRPKMFFWEFVVLLRKVLILAVALFWEDAFLQSVAAMFVLLFSVIAHMACWPYENSFMNIAELLTLVSLATVILMSILLWYARLRSDYLEYYEAAVTLILFLQYASLGIVLAGRVLLLELRERSATIVSSIPPSRPAFDALVRLGSYINFNLSGMKGSEWDEVQRSQDLKQHAWSFMRPIEEATEAKESKLETVQRLWRRRTHVSVKGLAKQHTAAVESPDTEAPVPSVRVETINPLDAVNRSAL